jgi:hypothetical protein
MILIFLLRFNEEVSEANDDTHFASPGILLHVFRAFRTGNLLFGSAAEARVTTTFLFYYNIHLYDHI